MKTQFQTSRFIFAALFSCAVIFNSCKKDVPVTPTSTALPIAPGDGVFVTDEGNFQGGNAMVSFYRYSDGSTTEDLYKPMNNSFLGDVCQSMSFINGKAYVVVNNSGKIEMVNPSNFKNEMHITGFTAPRYIQQISPTKAYVSDMFNGHIFILDLSTNFISGIISVPGMAESITVSGTEAFVSSLDHDKIYVINTTTDQITDSIAVAKGANSMVTDVNGKIWVLSYGDYFTSAPGGLERINPANHTVEQAWPFTTAESPTRLSINGSGDTLFYLNYGVMKMPINAASTPVTPYISQGSGQNFYGLNVNPTTNEIFVTDAVDYSQRGHLLRYSITGTLLDNKLVGIIPGGIYFY